MESSDVVAVLLSTVRLPMMPSMPSAAPPPAASSMSRMDSASKPSSLKSISPSSSTVSGLAGDGAGSRKSRNTLLTGAGDEQFLAPDGLCGCVVRAGMSRSRNAESARTGSGGRRSEEGSNAAARPESCLTGGRRAVLGLFLTGKTEGWMDASSAAASLYAWFGRFRGARARFSDTDVADDDVFDASDSVDDGDECTGRSGDECEPGDAAAAFTMSRSKRRPVGMQEDDIAVPQEQEPLLK
uniref:Uncharacterized protein n=1 Tax=Arundo donax TaxID=35708 RepID=A0A0A9E2N7_ARUDO